jgi:hypothetical protein
MEMKEIDINEMNEDFVRIQNPCRIEKTYVQ